MCCLVVGYGGRWLGMAAESDPVGTKSNLPRLWRIKTALTGFEVGFGFSPITQNGGGGGYGITDIRPDPDPDLPEIIEEEKASIWKT